MILDECLPPALYDMEVYPKVKFLHVRDLDLGMKSDKDILLYIISMAVKQPDRNFVFFTRDRGFEKDSGYNTLEDVPPNLSIVVLQRSDFTDHPDLRSKVINGHRSDLVQIILALFASNFLKTTA